MHEYNLSLRTTVFAADGGLDPLAANILHSKRCASSTLTLAKA